MKKDFTFWLEKLRHINEFESDVKPHNLIVFHVFFPGQTTKKKMFPVFLNKAKVTEKLSVCDLFCELCDIWRSNC